MSKLRLAFKEIKEGLLSWETERMIVGFLIANNLLILLFYVIANVILVIIPNIIGLSTFASVMCVMLGAIFWMFLLWNKAYNMVMRLTIKILIRLLGKYGYVIRKKDWKHIKKCSRKIYRELLSKKCLGYCYIYSWFVAINLEDTKLMYCSIESSNGVTAHSVVLKNNSIYDTNQRRHYNYETYMKVFGVKIYKIFEEHEFNRETFFEDTYKDFENWCKQNNVYCDPQKCLP